MPTKHRRHAVTETPDVQKALDALRAESGGQRLDFGELVRLGAERKLAAIRSERDGGAKGRRALVEQLRAGEFTLDPESAAEARAGWARR